MRASSTLKLSIATVVFLSACGDASSTDTSVAVKPKITISSTTDPTSEMIAEIYGQALEKAEFRVARKKPFATSEELLSALAAGEVQLSGLTSQALFNMVQAPGGTPVPVPNTTADQATAIAKGLPANVKMATPTTAEDKDVVFCAKTFTDTNTIATLTDLGAKPGIATLAAPDGFDTSTPLGAAGLKDIYKVEFKAIVPTTIEKVVEAVNAGTADCGVGRAADPALSVATLTVLQDDKALVPNDVIVPVVTTDAGTDDVLSVIAATSGRLTPDSLRTLMSRLKVDGASPEIVANEFTGNAGT
ncbi:MAG: glycine betaine ABC transporter substrate-binding protein [Ilumatobacteraceae bacterium]